MAYSSTRTALVAAVLATCMVSGLALTSIIPKHMGVGFERDLFDFEENGGSPLFEVTDRPAEPPSGLPPAVISLESPEGGTAEGWSGGSYTHHWTAYGTVFNLGDDGSYAVLSIEKDKGGAVADGLATVSLVDSRNRPMIAEGDSLRVVYMLPLTDAGYIRAAEVFVI